MHVVDGHFIPKGTSIMMFIYGLHHQEEFYPNPEKFDPDRFLPESHNNRDPFAYVPFGAGPRNCIGIYRIYQMLSNLFIVENL